MSKYNILVVDDEEDMVKVIVARLETSGFNIDAVNSGKEALEYVKNKIPDLILLDIFMPDMDGYTTCEKLREDKTSADIPIIMLTTDTLQADKVKALQMGIDDYITKPYDADELIARINIVLRRTKFIDVKTEVKNVTLRDQKGLDFLKHLMDKGIDKIEPEGSKKARNGYTYKIAADFFKTDDGSEIEELKYLLDKQVLIKKFFDKILVCPYCWDHDVNIRETNPSSRSANISVVNTIHHYRCAYIGTEKEFLQGIKYVCPKCNVDLKHIGVDYDKPGKIYVDNETGEKFQESDVNCQCRNCSHSFEAENAEKENIFSFVLANRAELAVRQGGFIEINLEQELLDQETEVYNVRYFRGKLHEEMERCKVFKKHLSVILVSVVNFDAILHDKGETVAVQLLKDLAAILKENLWKVDVPARYGKNSFINLVLEADKKEVGKVIASIEEKIFVLTSKGLDVKIKSVTFPDDAKNEKDLLEKLTRNSGS